MDGGTNIKLSGTKIVLEGPSDIVIKEALKFDFSASNNQVKYDAFMASTILALEIGATRLKDKSDS